MKLGTSGRKFKCNQCTFSSRSGIQQVKIHIKEVHDKVKDIICKYCGSAFSRRSNLNQHVKNVHLKKSEGTTCSKCGLILSTTDNLKNHLEALHLNKIKCKKCHSDFPDKAALKFHKKQVHEVRVDYGCTLCEKTYPSGHKLRVHVKAIHLNTGIRNHKCNICESSFYGKLNLKAHVNGVHLNRRDHTCGECGSSFKEKAFNTHMKRVHMKTKVIKSKNMQYMRFIIL